ncbi:hypothetical protein [Cellulomonas oligotrophica]|uniref:Uncharacterized protein n=1 Tax=Cellulomonas oligotrophica TaxID=931536 RepID=A0A7Y9FJU4_9CELL|nr:hypothetical protein [Cellulomonas oligotrophica]NYD87361.1 hypothetical protein [Cellulomonas oligotrophica]GIG34551.1 hypothetical protein Col01nite_37100 [Cellulomonas oligotrophica]
MSTREKVLPVVAAVEIAGAAVAARMLDWWLMTMLLAFAASALLTVRDLRRARLSGSADDRTR